MTTKNTTKAALKQAFQNLEAKGTWASAEELEVTEESMHWLTDKLWCERKLVGETWMFRAVL